MNKSIALVVLILISFALANPQHFENFENFENFEESEKVDPFFQYVQRKLNERKSDSSFISRKNVAVNVTGGTLTMLNKGDTCARNGYIIPNTSCKIGLQCSGCGHGNCFGVVTGVCVGPAKTGASCTNADSGFMCESGNYCSCNVAQSSCTCMKEVKDGGACHQGFQCQGGSACNTKDASGLHPAGTCTKYTSQPENSIVSDPIFCKFSQGLLAEPLLTTPGYKCVQTENKICTVPSDCISPLPFGVPYFDVIFYSCNAGKCVNSMKKCDSKKTYPCSAKYNNYWDYSDGGCHTSCSLYSCLYKDEVVKGGDSSCLALQAASYTGSVWVDVGGVCTSVISRCMIGSYCSNGVCVAYPTKAGDPCTIDIGAVNSMARHSVCDSIGKLSCSKYISSTSSTTNLGSLGTCEKPVKLNKPCFLKTSTMPDGSNTINVDQIAYCDAAAGELCNLNTQSTTEISGVCVKKGTIKAGASASGSKFCQEDAVYVPNSGSNFGVCKTYADAAIPCTTWKDCHIIYDYDYYGLEDYIKKDYDYGTHVPYTSWGLYKIWGNFLECDSGKCARPKNAANCHAQDVSKFNYYKVSPSCDYTKCVFKDATYNGFTICVSAAQTFTPSILIIVSIISMLMLNLI